MPVPQFLHSRRGLAQFLLFGGLYPGHSLGLAQTNRIDLIRSDAPALVAYGRLQIGVQTLQLKNPNQWDLVNAKPGLAIPL